MHINIHLNALLRHEICQKIYTAGFSGQKFYTLKGWLPSAELTPTFTFLGRDLPTKSIEYGKIPTKKSESWFQLCTG